METFQVEKTNVVMFGVDDRPLFGSNLFVQGRSKRSELDRQARSLAFLLVPSHRHRIEERRRHSRHPEEEFHWSSSANGVVGGESLSFSACHRSIRLEID